MSDVSIKAYSGGNIYDLSQLACGFFLQDHGGLGIAEVFRHAQRGPFQLGDTDLGFTQAPRFVTLGWMLQGRDNFDLWELREELYSVFRPRVDDPTQLVFSFPNKIKRAIDVNLIGDINIVSPDRIDGRTWRAAVQLKASDPRLYDPTQRVETFNLLDSSGGWEIEETGQTTADGWNINTPATSSIANGWNIGISNFFSYKTIIYANRQRNADIEWPIIRLFGPITDPIIENLTTGESIPLTANGGLQLLAGEWITIDLRYDSGKSIVDQDGNDVTQYLEEANDLATWHLSYATEKVDGNTIFVPVGGRSDGQNLIRITGTGATIGTYATITYYDRYIGV